MRSRIGAALVLVAALLLVAVPHARGFELRASDLPAGSPGGLGTREVGVRAPAMSAAASGDGVWASARPAAVLAAARHAARSALIVLGVIAGVLLLAGLGSWLARRQGFTLGAETRHGFSEASYRVGGLWEEFRDWLRIGR